MEQVDIKLSTAQDRINHRICLHCKHFKEIHDWHTRTGLAYTCTLNNLRVEIINTCERHEIN